MPCEKYQYALNDLAASGGECAGNVRAHLDRCASCHAYMESEQFLFAAIDSGISAAANEGLPSSLLLRLEARVFEENSAKPTKSLAWKYVAAAAVIVLSVVWTLKPQGRRESLRISIKSEAIAEKPVSEPLIAASRETSGPASVVRTHQGKRAEMAERIAETAASHPEVLVPPDEREAFARFLARAQGRKNVAQALLHEAPGQEQESLHLVFLQIARLEIQPLEWQNEPRERGEPER
jgi:hypothetical protein